MVHSISVSPSNEMCRLSEIRGGRNSLLAFPFGASSLNSRNARDIYVCVYVCMCVRARVRAYKMFDGNESVIDGAGVWK